MNRDTFIDKQVKAQQDAYIRGYVDAIATLFDRKGGQKTAALMYSYDEMRRAGVHESKIIRVKQWLEKP